MAENDEWQNVKRETGGKSLGQNPVETQNGSLESMELVCFKWFGCDIELK
jgi:hypothetical protein